MRKVRKGLVIGMLWACLLGCPGALFAQSPGASSPEVPAARLEEQNRKLSDELRRIHREIAALRADLDKPRLKDAVSGIGYIFGLFGVAAYVAARRKE